MSIYMIGYDLHPVKERITTGSLQRLKPWEPVIGIALIRHGLSRRKRRRPK